MASFAGNMFLCIILSQIFINPRKLLQKLTGGTLLSRDGQFIVFYRGKDFLPPAVSSAIEERRSEIIKLKQNTNENMKTPLSYEPGMRRSASVYELQEATETEQPAAKRETLNPVTSALERVNAKLSQVNSYLKIVSI